MTHRKTISYISPVLVLVVFAFSAQADTTSTIPVNSCREITSSGNYKLANNLYGQKDIPCLDIHDTQNVYIDCNYHTISGLFFAGILFPVIKIQNVQNFSLGNCSINSTIDPDTTMPVVTQLVAPLIIKNSSNGSFVTNTFGPGMNNIENSNTITFTGNQFNSPLQLYSDQYIALNNNIFTPSATTLANTKPDVIELSNGKFNSIVGNTIDGAFDGIFRSPQSVGADDGIVITDETDDIIQNNVIRNNWDCGFETTGFIYRTKVDNNQIINSGFCGIGAWYYNSWRDNVVTNNTINNAQTIFNFFRLYGMRDKDIEIAFLNNTFSGNIFINKRNASDAPARFTFESLDTTLQGNDVRLATRNDLKLGNNTFSNNNFGNIGSPPIFYPASMIVDGGGNVCAPGTDQNFPLVCGGPNYVATPTPTPSITPLPYTTPTPTPTSIPTPASHGFVSLSALGLKEGDTISAAGSSDPDIYIANAWGYKRLFLNPIIFNFYGHLGGFAKVKNIVPSTRDMLVTSGLFQNCETNDPKVYGIETTGEDMGILHWVNTSGVQAVADDANFFKKVFCINSNEFNWYAKGSDYASVNQVPAYTR